VLSELPQQDLPAAQEEHVAGSESLAKPAPFLTDEAMTLIEDKINTCMTIDKPFTQVRYSIGDLSRDVGVPTYKLSYFINNRYGLNFYGFLNRYRIQYCLQKFQAEEHHLKTLDALALECGFQSRATFVRAFKGVTGKTPSDYLAGHA
jgi:AraC-like DNA-binding protein